MPSRQWSRLAGALAVLFVVAAVVATARSTSHHGALRTAALGEAPNLENETAQAPDAPDVYEDFKDSSGQPVTGAMLKRASAQAAAISSVPDAGPWQLTGPANVGGRVVDLVVDNQHADTMYVATSGGGIWKSTDAGMTYTPAWPTATTQTMGAIAQGSDGTLYVGTGEANPSGGGLTFTGDGMYKSTDGGNNWTHIGLEDSAAIGRLAVDPSNPQVVYAAATGDIRRSVSQRGLYKTTDGGQTWTQVLAPPNGTTGAVDVAVDPANPQRVYAALWDHHRNNGARVYGGIGSGLFRSDDGGQTWTRLQRVTTPLPDYDRPTIGGGSGRGTATAGSTTLTGVTTTSGAFQVGHHIVGTGIPAGTTITAVDAGAGTLTISNAVTTPSTNQPETLTDYRPPTGLTADPSLGRIGVAIAPSDPNRVYVVSGAPYGPDKGTFVSNDGGDSFQTLPSAYAANGYQWWFGRIWVDPTDENHVYNADVGLRESTDGGQTWHSNSGLHSDQHAMAWDPRVPGRVYEGNDGGTYRSDTNGASSSWVHGTYEPWNQGYHLAVATQDDDRMATGLQDNGSVRSWTNDATNTDLSQFNSYGGGDGHWVAIDPTNEHTYFACSQNAGCNGYQDVPGLSKPSSWRWRYPSGVRFTTDAAIGFDPSNPQIMYVGGAALLRSTDQGHTQFQAISPIPDADSLPGPIPDDEIDLGGEYDNQYGSVTAFGISKQDGNVIFAGTDTGKLWKTSDLGAHWTQMQGVPERWVNAVVVDPDNQDHVYAAFSGYREGDYAANVYETTDGGASWHNVSGNMPNAPVEMIAYDAPSNMLFAATSYGVFERKDGDQYWYGLKGGLPNSPVLDVKISADHKWLYADTFGRSILRMPLSVSVTQGAGNGGGVGGTVPATLSLTLGAPASFGAFTPGVDRTYDAQTSATVTSTAGDALLTVSDPDTAHPGHLVNGSFFLPEPLQAKATKGDTTGTAFNSVGSSLNLLTWSAPVSNDPVSIFFEQRIKANDALRTGTYDKTLTFTLSTTNP
jgi:photosystem II stability/assembly factor-like uncharacterized protein